MKIMDRFIFWECKIEKRSNSIERIIHILSIIIVVCFALYRILPILILRDNYVFTIHDNLDYVPGFIRAIKDSGTYFSPNMSLDILNGMQEKYLLTNYNFHDFVCVIFGYVIGETINKIVGTILGFFTMRALLNRLFRPRANIVKDIVLLISIGYATLPCQPTRIVPFAVIPLIVLYFLWLKNIKRINWLSFLSVVFPVFLCMRSSLLFVIGFYFVGMITIAIIERRVNPNILVSFVVMCLSSIPINLPTILVAISQEPTNRALLLNMYRQNNFKSLFLNYIHGQYHAPTLHDGILMWFLVIGTMVIFALQIINQQRGNGGTIVLSHRFLLLISGFLFWLLSTALMAAYESGLNTGIKLIDSFAWGRVQAFTRIVFVIMFMAIVVSLPQKKILQIVCLVVAFFQLCHVSFSDCYYNDDFSSINAVMNNYENSISYKEFFSKDLFAEIKREIGYNNEGVAAYGYHPGVLMANGFNTIDGYCDVHPMSMQNGFRRIIEPAFKEYPSRQSYYDNWGGRMYLFGQLLYAPEKRDTSNESYILLIDTEAFKDYGGKYILSRGKISNISDLGLKYVNDFSSEESIYHIYLYEAI